ncbi:MAG TPA: outer membrane protein transport protein [Casimicrobiaceae bacterium]|nr:outer membrane protein transport protein [Casimicrobiaceae bacterium]
MTTRRSQRWVAVALVCAGMSAASGVQAGGIILYEIGTADVGLASAGYTARAQDASTVFTNPAGMTRLSGNQLTLGAQLLYADLAFSIDHGTSPRLGTNDGGNPVGWFPGGGTFYSYSVSPGVKLGIAISGNFGLAEKYNSDWVGRYYVQQSTLIGASFLPSIAWRVNDKVSLGVSVNAMYGKFKDVVAVNNIVGPDGQLTLNDHTWGWGANVGLLYEMGPGSRFGITYNSPVNLNFSAPTQFSGLSPGLEAVLRARGLFDANVDLGMTVPQGVNASFYHEIDPRWALLGSVGWQQWSKFGKVDVGVDSNDPRSLTTNLNYKDTWHVAGGAQYKMTEPWTLNFGVAYDSAFQGDNIPVALPANSLWRFGIGAQKEESKTFNWGASFEYAYGGTLNTDAHSVVPVELGGRGDLVGSYKNTSSFFFAANFNWKL